MARISDAELDGLLELIGEVNHADDLGAYREAVLTVLPRVIPAPNVSYNEVDFDGVPGFVAVRPDDNLEALYDTWKRLAPQNPLLARYLRTRDSRAYRWSDVISRSELEALEIYRELYVPQGIRHQMAMTMVTPEGSMVGIVLSGPDDFSDAQREVLDLARPHLVQAFMRVSRRPDIETLTPREREVLEAMTRGLATREIAAQLGISERTVHKHAERIYAKLGVRDRVAAVSSVLAR